jgi:excisionase family DNA binding protein
LETYLTVEELAAYLKFTEQTIRRWILNHEVPYHKINNSVRFSLSEIDMWVVKNEAFLKAGGKAKTESGLFDGLEKAEGGNKV